MNLWVCYNETSVCQCMDTLDFGPHLDFGADSEWNLRTQQVFELLLPKFTNNFYPFKAYLLNYL